MRPDKFTEATFLKLFPMTQKVWTEKKTDERQSILHNGAQKAASQQKTIYIKRESNTLTVGHYSSVLMGFEMSAASSTVGLKTKE